MGGLVLGLAGVGSTLWVSVGLIAVAFTILLPAPALPAGDPPVRRGPSRSAAPAPKVPMLGAIFMATFLASFLVGIVIAAGVPHLDHAAGAPEGAYGFALACYSLGAIFGGWISGLIPWQNRHLPAVLLISSGGYGLIAAAGMIGPWWTILLSWFVWGICFGPEDILTDRYVASKTPDEALARLYARWSNIGRFGAAAAYVAMLTWGTANPTTLTFVISLAAAALAPLLIALALTRSPAPPVPKTTESS